jgi:hypothetical protein
VRTISGWIFFLAAGCLAFMAGTASREVLAVDITFNISFIAESQPIAPAPGSTFFYGDVWSENGYVYVGSDRGVPRSGHVSNGQAGISVFSLSNSGIPTFLPPPTPPPAGFQGTTYFGNEMEDVEVWDGIGYFGSDYNPSDATLRTGVDIVDLSIPFEPIMLSRIDETDCLAGNPGVCAHGKVHTVSIQRINENTPSEQRYLYTSDNESDVIKISDVSNPAAPALIRSLDIGAPSGVASHEVVVRSNRLFVASKSSSTSTNGWFHIYDVADPANPVLLKSFLSGAATHTAMPTDDGNTLIVAEERSNGNVKIYDISMIDQPNDPQSPVLLATLNKSNVCHNGDCIDAHSPHHVHVHGNLLFLPWYEAGLQVFNIVDPENPVYVGAYDTWVGTSTNFNGNWGVDLSQGLDRVLISDRTRGLIVLDATGVVDRGDFNTDLEVDESDYQAWKNAFGGVTSGTHNGPLADGNYDESVDAADYVVWRKFSALAGAGAGGAVPEPACGVVLVIATGVMIFRWRLGRV